MKRRKFLGLLAFAPFAPAVAKLLPAEPMHLTLGPPMTATEVQARTAAAMAELMDRLKDVDIMDCIDWKAVGEELERCR